MHEGIYPELAGIKVARQQVVDLISTVQEVKNIQSFTHLLAPLLHLQVFKHVQHANSCALAHQAVYHESLEYCIE